MSALPTSRLDFRVSPEHKSLIERAANVQGQTVSSFAISTLLKAAEQTIQDSTTRTLSARDFQKFIDLLDSDAKPNAALMAAAKRYKARRRGR